MSYVSVLQDYITFTIAKKFDYNLQGV